MPGSDEESLTEENCKKLYRPPEEGEETSGEPHAHVVTQITRKQVRIKNAAEDGNLADPDSGPEERWELSRGELERYGHAYHGPLGARFYRSRKEARKA